MASYLPWSANSGGVRLLSCSTAYKAGDTANIPLQGNIARAQPPQMTSNAPPTLEDNIRDFVEKYNLRHDTHYYDVRIFVIACSVSSSGERLLMQKETETRSNEKQIWHIPEIDLTELPGSTGINGSLQDIVLQYCGQIFLTHQGVVKFLISEKGKNEPGEKSTLMIYVIVCYPRLPLVKLEKGQKFGLVTWAHLNGGYERLRSGKAEFDILDSAIDRAKLDDWQQPGG